MGIDSLYREKETSDFDFYNDLAGGILLDHENINNVVYLAVDVSDDEDGSDIECKVAFQYWHDDPDCPEKYKGDSEVNFSYAIYTEMEVPQAYDCPEKILGKLTEPKSEGAAEWRKQCSENN